MSAAGSVDRQGIERVVVADGAAAAARAAALFADAARRAVAARGRFVVALAGGSTPKAAYRLLAVAAPVALTPPVPRVTLTFPALDASREVMVLAVGAEKRDAVRAALGGGSDAPPAGRVHGRERTVWVLDELAAG